MILTSSPLRIAFFGTNSFAAYHLYVLLHCSIHKIVVVFTQEKKFFYQKSPWSVLHIATAFKLNIFLSYKLLTSDIIHILEELKIDIVIVVSYGLIFSKKMLTIPKLGCLNVHGSLLPRWRGAAPIQRAIEYGDHVTGVSIIQMSLGIDTGYILYTKTCKILSTDNSDTLSKKLAQIGSTGLLKTIDRIALGIVLHTIHQNVSYATYASKLKKIEARINWKLSAITIERRIRAFNPWPISYFYIHKKRVNVWIAQIDNQNNLEKMKHISLSIVPGTILKTNDFGIYVATGTGILILTVLQISGKKKLSAKDLLNGYKHWFSINTILK